MSQLNSFVPVTSEPAIEPSEKPASRPNPPAWYHPTISHEHGVYVMLLVAFLTGVAAAQTWTGSTTLALACAFFGFQAEHPFVLQIKQRKGWKPRFLVWGGLYSLIALAIAVYLALQTPILWGIYAAAVLAFLIDAISVLHREQKSVTNELITFSAVCLSAPLAYAATTETISTTAIALWILNTLFFSSAIFTVKLRKPKTSSILLGIVYHAIATVIVIGLWFIGWLSPITTVAFTVMLLKFSLILWQQEWYRTTKVQFVAMLETGFALAFLIITSLSLLPAHLA